MTHVELLSDDLFFFDVTIKSMSFDKNEPHSNLFLPSDIVGSFAGVPAKFYSWESKRRDCMVVRGA
jgi:hypothetical protein